MKEKLYSAQPVLKLYERPPSFIAREVLKLAQQEKYRPLSYFTSIRPEANAVLDFGKLNFPSMLLYIVEKEIKLVCELHYTYFSTQEDERNHIETYFSN